MIVIKSISWLIAVHLTSHQREALQISRRGTNIIFDFPSVPVSWRFKWATSLLQVLLSFPDPAVCNKVNKLLSAPSSFQSISPEDFSHLHDNGAMERQLRICLTSHTNTLISVFLPCRPLFSNKFSRGLGSAEISRPQLGSTLWRWGPTQRDLLC